MQNKPDFIFFDLDGTLSQLPKIVTALAGLYDKTSDFLKKVFGPRTPSKPKIKVEKFETEKSPLKYAFLRAILSPVPQHGLHQLLTYLDHQEIESGVVSNGPFHWGNPFLTEFKLHHHFECANFRDAHKNLKPAPDPLLAAVDEVRDLVKQDPKVVWFVGDQASDVETAVNAAHHQAEYEVVPIAIGTNTSAAKKLRALQSDGQALNGLTFADYHAMLAHLKKPFSP